MIILKVQQLNSFSLLNLLIQLKQKNEMKLTKQPLEVASLIRDNIVNVLNVRQGTVSIRDDMGLPDFRNMSMLTDAQMKRIAQLIEAQLACFETRLKKLQVQCEPATNGRILFKILINGLIPEQINDLGSQLLTMTLHCMNNGKIVAA